jgi:signal peptidase II
LVADLASKHYVFASMLRDPHLPRRIRQVQLASDQTLTSGQVLRQLHLSRQVLPGVRFTIATNPGVVFGLPMPRWAVLATTAITIALVTFFFAGSHPNAWFTHTAMACILSGAMGNLYDRMFSEVALPGMEPIRRQVRDFIDCSQLHYYSVFNLADALLVIGAAMLVLHWLAGRAVKRKPA